MINLDDINEIKDKTGTEELWSYGIGSLYFKNGVLVDKKIKSDKDK